MKTLTCASIVLLFGFSATPALAQATPPAQPKPATSAAKPAKKGGGLHGYVTVNGLAQPANSAISDRFTFDANAETATAEVRYPSKVGVGGEGGVGLRLWRQLGAGVTVTYVSSSGSADVEASIPHPFLFGQPRTVTGSEGDIARSETDAHVQLLYFVPTRGALQFVLSAGPSFVTLQQEVLTEVRYTEIYPYDTATYSRAAVADHKGSAVGFNVGADVRWMFSKSVGVGGVVRFTRATVDLDVANGRTLAVDTGGVQAGGGIRFRF